MLTILLQIEGYFANINRRIFWKYHINAYMYKQLTFTYFHARSKAEAVTVRQNIIIHLWLTVPNFILTNLVWSAVFVMRVVTMVPIIPTNVSNWGITSEADILKYWQLNFTAQQVPFLNFNLVLHYQKGNETATLNPWSYPRMEQRTNGHVM